MITVLYAVKRQIRELPVSGHSANYSPPPSLLDNKVTYFEKIPSDSKEQMIIVSKYCFIVYTLLVFHPNPKYLHRSKEKILETKWTVAILVKSLAKLFYLNSTTTPALCRCVFIFVSRRARQKLCTLHPGPTRRPRPGRHRESPAQPGQSDQLSRDRGPSDIQSVTGNSDITYQQINTDTVI